MVATDGKEDWDTWENHVGKRQESRMDVYLGKPLKTAVSERAQMVGLSMTGYVSACVRHFIYNHTTDADPRD